MKVSAIFIVIAVLSTAFFVVHNSHYVMDDVFIGFRYASNIASGHGIVWNIGELPLEGYSNFGWIIIMAAFSFMDLVIAAKLIGLICLVAVGFVYYKISKDYPDLPDWKYVFAVALLFLLVGPAAAFHSTSGIGTILIGLFFLLLIYSAYIVYEYKKPMKWFFVIALIISLLRPEGMLPSIALTIFLMWKNRNIRLPVSKEKKSNKTIRNKITKKCIK